MISSYYSAKGRGRQAEHRIIETQGNVNGCRPRGGESHDSTSSTSIEQSNTGIKYWKKYTFCFVVRLIQLCAWLLRGARALLKRLLLEICK